MPQDLIFNKDTHEYAIEGRRVPSVTQILGEWVQVKEYYVNTFTGTLVAASVFKEAGDRGTAVHEAVNILLTLDLDWEYLDPALIYPLKQFIAWREKFKPQLVTTGYPMYSRAHGFAGTPDPFYLINGMLTFVDIKTGLEHPMVGPQTAAYVQMYREISKFKGGIKRYSLYLPMKKGTYKYEALDNKMDWQFFRAKHFCYKYEQGLRGK